MAGGNLNGGEYLRCRNPPVVTGLVAKNGIAGNGIWWNYTAGGMLTVFLFARLWRRSGVITDIEFSEIRYAGKPAAFLHGFRSIYLGLPINRIILGWVNLAMVKILMLVLAERYRRDSGWRTAVRATHVVVGHRSLYLLGLVEARLRCRGGLRALPWRMGRAAY